MSVYSNTNTKDDIQSFKILTIGSSGVGKSSLLIKYVKNAFSYDYHVTTGIQYFTKSVKINQKTHVKLQLWDTAGQQAFKSIIKSLYKGVSAILLVFSIERQQSFEQLQMWFNQIKQNSHPETIIFLVGAKIDLQQIRKIPKKKAEQFMKTIQAVSYMEISSKTGQNVKQLFDKVAKIVHKKFQQSSKFRSYINPMLSNSNQKSQSFNLSSGRYSEEQKSNSWCCF